MNHIMLLSVDFLENNLNEQFFQQPVFIVNYCSSLTPHSIFLAFPARLVYDRETGKPKGYGFCEYQDIETAQSAMRNLNNHDFNGRPLRVGVAAGEQNKDEMKSESGLYFILFYSFSNRDVFFFRF